MKTKLISVAIADSQSLFRELLAEKINTFENHSVVIQAADGQSLIEQLEKAKCIPDITILEVPLPGLDGYDTLTILKRKWTDLKTLVLTDSDHHFTIMTMLRLGANGYLSKSIFSSELYTALRSIHENGLYLNDVLQRYMYITLRTPVDLVPEITAKEKSFLQFCGSDLTLKEIADRMNTTQSSVEGYRNSLFKKLNVHSINKLVLIGLQTGLIKKPVMSLPLPKIFSFLLVCNELMIA